MHSCNQTSVDGRKNISSLRAKINLWKKNVKKISSFPTARNSSNVSDLKFDDNNITFQEELIDLQKTI